MPWKTPNFWATKDSLAATLLLPLSCAYSIGHRFNQGGAGKPYKSSLPVICVGNLTMGGSGKTPTVLALLNVIKEENLYQNPVVLTRGYGGSVKDATLLATSHTAKDVGDEALLLARHAPVIISPNRAAGAVLAEQNGFDCILMDDGFQNPTLHKDISLIVIDGAYGFGNEYLFPAGPLREPLEDGLTRADGFVLIGEDKNTIAARLPDKPLIKAAITPDIAALDSSNPYFAFCGIGRPEKFYDMLRGNGITLADTHDFPDHHAYTDSDIAILKEQADHLGARLLTTEKDAVKLPDSLDFDVVPISLNFETPGALRALLAS